MPGGVRTSCSLEEQRHWPSLQLSSALFSQQDPILPPPPPFTTGQEEVLFMSPSPQWSLRLAADAAGSCSDPAVLFQAPFQPS